MRRREFITLLGGAAAAWPLSARAQRTERVRRIVYLHAVAENDPEEQARVVAFRLGLETLGWIENRNIQVEHRFAAGELARMHAHAAEYREMAGDAQRDRARRQADDAHVQSADGALLPVFLREFGTAAALDAEISATHVHDETEIEAAAAAFGRKPEGGLIAPPDPFMNTRRVLIMALAERHRLPAIYGFQRYVREGARHSRHRPALGVVR